MVRKYRSGLLLLAGLLASGLGVVGAQQPETPASPLPPTTSPASPTPAAASKIVPRIKVFKIVPLQYLTAIEATRLLNGLSFQFIKVVADPRTNSLIIESTDSTELSEVEAILLKLGARVKATRSESASVSSTA